MSQINNLRQKVVAMHHERSVSSIAERSDRLFTKASKQLNIDDEPLRQSHIMRFTSSDKKKGYGLLPTTQELHNNGKLVTDVRELTRDTSPIVVTTTDTNARFDSEHSSGRKVASFVDRVLEGVDRSATANTLGGFGLDHASVIVVSTADGLMTQNPDTFVLPLDATSLRVDTYAGFDLSKIGQ